MVKPLGSFVDEGLENLEKGIKQAVKQQVQATVQSVKSQTTGANVASASQAAGANESASNLPVQQQGTPQSNRARGDTDAATKDVVNSFYAPTNPDEKHGMSGKAKKPSEFFEKQIKEGKTPEEAVKLESLRKKLHDETYYIPLTQRKPQEEEQEEEEQKEKVEKMEELKLEEEKKEQDDDVALRQATHKTEQNPGASG